MDGFKPQESFGGEALIPTDSSTKNQSLHNSSTVLSSEAKGGLREPEEVVYPIHAAAAYGCPHLVRMLLLMGANPKIRRGSASRMIY